MTIRTNPPPANAPAMPPMAAAFMPGATGSVPPPSVPLGFLTAAGVGMVGFGFALWFAADHIVGMPTYKGAISAVHVGMLAFLTTAVLGAIHQFSTVVGRAPLRSIPVARVTMVGMIITGWLLPSGFAHGPTGLIVAGGLVGATTVLLAAWNTSRPLLNSGGGVPVAGLRLSMTYLLVTVGFGVVYAFNLEEGWFPATLPSRLLAHAHFGLIGWLGLTYVAVAEKLWPMFLLAHRPSARSGAWAVGLIGGGVPILALGLLFGSKALAWPGGVLVVAGFACHLTSLAGVVKHRRRPLELLHAFLFSSAAFLVAAIVLGTIAGLAPVGTVTRSHLIVAEVASLVAWLGLAIVGHAHKIVPFISYNALRGRGITKGPTGRPLMFGDLFDRTLARITFGATAGGFLLLVVGILSESRVAVAVAGVAIAAAGLTVTVNLIRGPRRALRFPQDVTPAPKAPRAPAGATP